MKKEDPDNKQPEYTRYSEDEEQVLLPELAYFYSPAASCHAEFFHVWQTFADNSPSAVRLLLPEQGGDDQMGIGLHW